ncbi:MAG: sulfatase, partial [Planctomycetaceae bacterium]|nr:sulfatase [Planctomycetaceae bacterium]
MAFTLHFAISSHQNTLVAADQPNILWITSEDNGLEVGSYGDKFATTPHIDALAKIGMKYQYCWSNAPVCAPARTTIISGMYPTCLGAQHMRSTMPMPKGIKMYPQYLREAGYYCTNNSKEDYNLEKPGKVWDQSNRKAHWKNRPDDKPFFSIFNHTQSHESKLRVRPHTAVHDPAGVRIPAYHPDTPEVRQDWAQYYDTVTEMDQKVGLNFDELKKSGRLEDTIIFYYGDHGSGMPRHKRWPYNTGLHVPMIVYFPPKFQHLAPPEYKTGGSSDRLVSFVDLAPTVLSIAGIKPPSHMQGHAFAGEFTANPQPYIYGYRGRMDERPDMVRSIRDERYVYIRHFNPHRPYGQFLHYMFQTPTTRVWYQMHLDGKLNATQDAFWQNKPTEELYDLQADRDEVNNLVDSPEHEQTLASMRKALYDWMIDTNDLGAIPEAELHQRCGSRSPYDVNREGKLNTDLQRDTMAAILATYVTAETLDTVKKQEGLEKTFQNEDSIIRYWACTWALKNGKQGVDMTHSALLTSLSDSSSSVRIVAAEALGRYGSDSDLTLALPV